jgi:hypothetical protein
VREGTPMTITIDTLCLIIIAVCAVILTVHFVT